MSKSVSYAAMGPKIRLVSISLPLSRRFNVPQEPRDFPELWNIYLKYRILHSEAVVIITFIKKKKRKEISIKDVIFAINWKRQM